MNLRRVLCCAFVAALGALAAWAAGPEVPNVIVIHPERVAVTDGPATFVHDCAWCHGNDGRGLGRAATSCSVAPADLTRLAAANGGQFPHERVSYVLLHRTTHGSPSWTPMPEWSLILRETDRENPARTMIRARNLADYLETLQQ